MNQTCAKCGKVRNNNPKLPCPKCVANRVDELLNDLAGALMPFLQRAKGASEDLTETMGFTIALGVLTKMDRDTTVLGLTLGEPDTTQKLHGAIQASIDGISGDVLERGMKRHLPEVLATLLAGAGEERDEKSQTH
jgi:hypothetical protein